MYSSSSVLTWLNDSKCKSTKLNAFNSYQLLYVCVCIRNIYMQKHTLHNIYIPVCGSGENYRDPVSNNNITMLILVLIILLTFLV